MNAIKGTISYLEKKLLKQSYIWLIFTTLFLTQCGIAQRSTPAGLCESPKFDKEVAKWIRQSVPIVGAEELYRELRAKRPLVLLDARDQKEYDVSHLPGALRVGYDDFEQAYLEGVPKDARVVVYCSIGYRSEKIGEKLQKIGYKNVRNLYGSIFDWANREFPLVNSKGDTVKTVHTYNEDWGRWVDEKHAKKTW